MRLKPQKGSWILGVLFLVAVVFPSFIQASASPTPGITMTVYNNFGYNASPPLPEESGRPEVGTTTVYQIDQDFDQSIFFGMYEDFIVKYEGHITSPVTADIIFWPWADDGTKFILDGTLIDPGNWVDKGGGGYQTSSQSFVAGVSRPFTYWYYENGGRSMDKALLGYWKWLGDCASVCFYAKSSYTYNYNYSQIFRKTHERYLI